MPERQDKESSDDEESMPSETKQRNADRRPYPTKLTHNVYNVGWVCALPKEQTAATAMLDEIHLDLPKPPNDYNTYTLGSICKHNVVIACLPKGKYGTNSAAAVATRMVGTFPSIRVGLMVGIGGGIPPKIRLGDVVVSLPVNQYPGVVQWDMGKAEKNGNFNRTGALNNPPSVLLTALTKLETKHEMHGSKICQYLDDLERNWPNLAAKYTWSDSLKDPLLTPNSSHRPWSIWQLIFSMSWEMILSLVGRLLGWWEFALLIHRAQRMASSPMNVEVNRARKDVRVHYGLVASGNQVIKDAKFRDSLNKSLGGNVLCIEMEAAGLINDFPCVVIRGICDYADSRKNEDWQEYAAAVAAAFAKELLEYVQPSEVHGERPVKEILGQVLNTLSKTGANIETVRMKLDRKEDFKLLTWLTPIDHGLQHTDFLKRRQPGTGQWLLDSTEYQTWLSANKQTLFCPGIPGAGKTILTSLVVTDLYDRFQDDTSIGIAYLYCNFRRQDQQGIDDLLANLLKQLTNRLAALPGSVKDLYNRHKYKRTRPLSNEIAKVLQLAAGMYSRVFIIVDALDECQVADGCRTKLVSELFNLQKRNEVNIFATSRFVPEIIDQFKGGQSLEIRANNQDVNRYLEGRMVQLPFFIQQNRQLQEDIKMVITEEINGMFLLAQIYFDLLTDKITLNDIRTALKAFQSQGRGSGEDQKVRILSCVYEQAMERINRLQPGLKELAIKVLLWITCAKRPLTTSELQYALAIRVGKLEFDQGDLPQIGDMVSVCAGLVTVDEESQTIRLVHYTTQEYFERTQNHWFPDAESDIATTCITYLSFSIFESGFCGTDGGLRNQLQQFSFLGYAAEYWGHHAHQSSGEAVQKLALDFLEQESKLMRSVQVMRVLDEDYSVSKQNIATKLGVAAYFGLAEITQLLLDAHADIDEEGREGATALHFAVEMGHVAVVRLLLERKADVDSASQDEETALHIAAREGNIEIVQLLLDAGADVGAINSTCEPALDHAIFYQHDDVAQLLLEKHIGDREWIALLPAARWGQTKTVRRLLEEGAPVDFEGYWGETSLHAAAQGGKHAVVRLLLKNGADVNKGYDYSGNRIYERTALHEAASNGHYSTVRLLLRNGADIAATDAVGKTALDIATNNGHNRVVQLLHNRAA